MLTRYKFSSEGNEQVGSFGMMMNELISLWFWWWWWCGSNFNLQMGDESINKKYGW